MGAEDNTLDMFHRYISNLYDLRIPLTLTDRRIHEIQFVLRNWTSLPGCEIRKYLVACQKEYDPESNHTYQLGRMVG